MILLPKSFENMTEWARRMVSVLERDVPSRDELGLKVSNEIKIVYTHGGAQVFSRGTPRYYWKESDEFLLAHSSSSLRSVSITEATFTIIRRRTLKELTPVVVGDTATQSNARNFHSSGSPNHDNQLGLTIENELLVAVDNSFVDDTLTLHLLSLNLRDV